MIPCRHLVEFLIEDYIGGELSPKQREQVEEHLSLCSSCVAYVESYCLTLQLLRPLSLSSLPAELQTRLQVHRSGKKEP